MATRMTQQVHVRIGRRYYQKLATLEPTLGYARLHERDGTLIPPRSDLSIWCGIHERKPIYRGLQRTGYQMHMGDEIH